MANRDRVHRHLHGCAPLITAIILAGLSVQYVIDGLAAIGLVTL